MLPPAKISMVGADCLFCIETSTSRSSSSPFLSFSLNFSRVALISLLEFALVLLAVEFESVAAVFVFSFESFDGAKPKPGNCKNGSSFFSFLPPLPGRSKSSKISSTCFSAASFTRSCISALTMFTPTAAKSRTIDSTSRPTYPTSVYFVASTLIKGAPHNFARRRAISVLPTPVGPIIKIFLGATSSRISSASFKRRVLLRKAIATAFFALFCPIM